MGTDENNAEVGFFALYTQRSRRAIVLAQEEARSMNHRYIDTEHLLLGLLRVGDGVAYNALSTLGVTLDDARRRVEEKVGRDVGREGSEPSFKGQLPFTSRMKEVLTQAVLEARWLGHDRHIGTEHLLLSLSGQYDCNSARVLNEQGVTPGKIRKEMMEKIGRGSPREGRTGPSGKTIKAWVGRQVRVAVENMGNGEPGRFACTLEGVDDRGVVVSYESGTRRITRFYPWRTVSYINLADSEGAKQAPRRAGFTPSSSRSSSATPL